MNLRGEKLARSLLVNDSFDQVAKIPFVQRKWIAAEAWFELIKKEVPNCAITDISLRWFKTYLLNSGRFIQDSNFPSPDGFYARQRKMKLDGMTTQKTITCFLLSPLNIHSQTNLLSHLNPDPQSSPNTVFQPSHIFIQDYWHSTEAKNLFGIEKTNEETDIREVMYDRLLRF